jgi:MYND finger protein
MYSPEMDTACLESFLDSIGEHPKVGDAVKDFKREFFPELDICEHCGLDTSAGSNPGRCKQCKSVHYCSVQCQVSDRSID